MTFTAMRPDFGFANGRDVSLWNVEGQRGREPGAFPTRVEARDRRHGEMNAARRRNSWICCVGCPCSSSSQCRLGAAYGEFRIGCSKNGFDMVSPPQPRGQRMRDPAISDIRARRIDETWLPGGSDHRALSGTSLGPGLRAARGFARSPKEGGPGRRSPCKSSVARSRAGREASATRTPYEAACAVQWTDSALTVGGAVVRTDPGHRRPPPLPPRRGAGRDCRQAKCTGKERYLNVSVRPARVKSGTNFPSPRTDAPRASAELDGLWCLGY
jgi:hypothetical protein